MTYAQANFFRSIARANGVEATIVMVQFVPTGHCADTRVFIDYPVRHGIVYGVTVNGSTYGTMAGAAEAIAYPN